MYVYIPGQGARRLGGPWFVVGEVLRDAKICYLGPPVVSNQDILRARAGVCVVYLFLVSRCRDAIDATTEKSGQVAKGAAPEPISPPEPPTKRIESIGRSIKASQ